MLVDKKPFKTYKLDNDITIKNRVAFEYDVLPRFLHFTKHKKDVETTNLVSLIKSSKRYESLASIYKKYKDMFPSVSQIEYCKLWYLYKPPRDQKDLLDFSELIEKEFKLSVQNVKINIEEFKESLKAEKTLLEEEIERQKNIKIQQIQDDTKH